MLAARETEVDRCKLIRAEMVGMQDELDRETERLASSLKERWEEEDQQIAAEVRGAHGVLVSGDRVLLTSPVNSIVPPVSKSDWVVR